MKTELIEEVGGRRYVKVTDDDGKSFHVPVPVDESTEELKDRIERLGKE